MKRYGNLWFWALLLLVLGIPFALLLAFAAPRLAGALPRLAVTAMHHLPEDSRRRVYDRILRDVDLFGPELVEHSIRQLSEEEKRELYRRVAAQVASWHDVLPEPDVGRIAQSDRTFVHRGVEVTTNNVGFRSRRPFRQKREGTYRIVCLGDSMVFGAGASRRTASATRSRISTAGRGSPSTAGRSRPTPSASAAGRWSTRPPFSAAG